MKHKIAFTLLIINWLICQSFTYSQSLDTSFSKNNQIINNSGKYKDSIIKQEWSPNSIPDSLLFDGIQKYTFPNTHLTLIPPKTYRADSQGNIIHDWTGSSIQCTIVNSSYSSLLKTIHKETFEKQGFTYINQETLSTHLNKEGTIFLIGFTLNGIEYERMVFFIGNSSETAWLSINYPVIMKSLLFETIENCLTTIEF